MDSLHTVDAPARQAAAEQLVAAHPGLNADVDRGIKAAAKVWGADAEGFTAFCVEHYAAPGPDRHAVAVRMDAYLGGIFGHLHQTVKEIRYGLDVDDGPLLPVDDLFASYAPTAHTQEDLRSSGLAAAVQLNFGGVPDEPDDKQRTAEEWLALNLSRIGTEAVPHTLRQEFARLETEAERLVQGYNLHLGNIKFAETEVSFPPNLRLISHWGLRDHMTGLTGSPDALPKQRAILGLMERVVRGDVPEAFLSEPEARWDMAAGTISTNGHWETAVPEGDRRWQPFHRIFGVQQQIDRYTRRPNLIDTMFLEHRKMTEARVEAMLVQLLGSPLLGEIARYVEQRVGRPLEPFDIYYKRFQDDTADTDALDTLTRARFPDRAALQAALAPSIAAVGFAPADAQDIANHIRVDPGRSAGHAWPPATPTDLQLLRVRVDPQGVSFQDFGTYMHELGHCVEGVLSSYAMPYRMLWGVPATAFSEAFAFTFQDLSMAVLGQEAARNRDVETIQRVWEAVEIAGPALVEMRLFRWLYAHPGAAPNDIHQAVQEIGDDVWAEFYAPALGADGHGLMSVYSHMLWGRFYLAEYPLGYIIAYQVRRYLQGRTDLAAEMTRMCRLGDIYPDAWMLEAVGERVSVDPMLEDAAAALARLAIPA